MDCVSSKSVSAVEMEQPRMRQAVACPYSDRVQFRVLARVNTTALAFVEQENNGLFCTNHLDRLIRVKGCRSPQRFAEVLSPYSLTLNSVDESFFDCGKRIWWAGLEYLHLQ